MTTTTSWTTATVGAPPPAPAEARRRELGRQLAHWRLAAERLADFDALAPVAAWQTLEHYLGVALRQALATTLQRLRQRAADVTARLQGAASDADLDEVRARILDLRRAYQRAETTVDFYGDVLATRAEPRMGALLRACDHIAARGMAEILTPLGRQVPAVLSFADAGVGAAIIRAGIRLADGSTDTPVATIKVTRHALLRPSATLHEAGHQVAHMLGWNAELSDALRRAAPDRDLGEVWAGWGHELAADAVAFVHAGYAAVAALHDVVDGSDAAVFQYLPTDPHPPGHVRILLGVTMARRAFGAGQWDALAAAWCTHHRLDNAPPEARGLLEAAVEMLPRAVEVILYTPYRAFRGQPLTAIVSPSRVSPAALDQLAREAGGSAFTSPYWLWNEAVRLVALTGFRAALGPVELAEAVGQQEQWMLRLGGMRPGA